MNYYIKYSTSGYYGQEVEPKYIPSEWDETAYQEAVLPFTPQEKKGGKGQKNWHTTEEREERYQDAKYLLDEYAQDDYVSVLQAVREYHSEFPDVIPYPLRNSPREAGKEAWRAFNRKTMPAARLFGTGKQLWFYTLHAEHLGLSDFYSESSNFPLGSYDNKLRKAWKQAIKKYFGKAARFVKWENAGRFHFHIVTTHDNALPEIKKSGEVIKPVQPGTELQLMRYLYKPHSTNTEENLAQWLHAKRISGREGKNLPHMCGYYNLPEVEKTEVTNPSDYSGNVIEDEYEQYIDLDTGIWIEERIEDREVENVVENLREIYTTYPSNQLKKISNIGNR